MASTDKNLDLRSDAEHREEYRCWDCGRGSEFYMIRNEVWLQAWPEYAAIRAQLVATLGEMRVRPNVDETEKAKRDRVMGKSRGRLLLCFECVEKRLGRELAPEDFDLKLVVNEPVALGYRMGLRALTREKK